MRAAAKGAISEGEAVPSPSPKDDLDSDDASGFNVDTNDVNSLSLDEEEDLLSALEGLARSTAEAEAESADEDNEEKPLTPLHLVKQQVLMEKAIRDVF